jgi:TonB family protein
MNRRERLGTWGLAGMALSLSLLTGCEQEPSRSRPSAPPSQAGPVRREEPGAWLTVDPEALRLAREGTIYHQGPAPPILQHRAPVEIPVDDPDALPQGTVIVEVVITSEGKVAQARVLRALPVEGLSAAIVASLRQWRFEPARLKGEPVAVYYTLTLRSEPRQASSEPQRPWEELSRPKTEPQRPGNATP